MDQRKAAGFIAWIQHRNQVLQPFARHSGANLYADWIRNATKIFNVRAVH